MSRARVRPTREETRQRLFEAAAAAFAEHGIGGASVEAITAAGGLTRGAFYSNFASKDELITAMLADHVEQTARRHLELLARHRDPDSFVAALMAVDRSEQDPLGRSPLLHLELILHTARAAERRPELTEFLQARRRLIVDIVKGTELAGSLGTAIDPEQVAAMLLAMEDGFRLHRLIDPNGTPPDSFVQSLSLLQRALSGEGLRGARGARGPLTRAQAGYLVGWKASRSQRSSSRTQTDSVLLFSTRICPSSSHLTAHVAEDEGAVAVHQDAGFRVADRAVLEVAVRQLVQVALLGVGLGVGVRVHEVGGEQLVERGDVAVGYRLVAPVLQRPDLVRNILVCRHDAYPAPAGLPGKRRVRRVVLGALGIGAAAEGGPLVPAGWGWVTFPPGDSLTRRQLRLACGSLLAVISVSWAVSGLSCDKTSG